jgi:hypothetical protein
LAWSTTRISARIRGSPERHRQRSTSDGRQRISPRSHPRAGGRAKALSIHRFASSTSTRNGGCPCSFEKLPEGQSPGGKRQPTCAPTEASQWARRWSVRAKARRNSHCTPKVRVTIGGGYERERRRLEEDRARKALDGRHRDLRSGFAAGVGRGESGPDSARDGSAQTAARIRRAVRSGRRITRLLQGPCRG